MATKKFDVYGIGNALVDMVFEVTEDFLKKANIAKGLAHVVDEARQTEITSTLNGIQPQKSCGGSAANTMIAISQFGGKSYFSCKVAKDELGEFYLKDLMNNDVQTNLSIQPLEEGITGKCIVLITPDGDRTLNPFFGITFNFSTKEIMEEQLKDSNFLYIEGFLVCTATGKDASIKAKKMAELHGVKTSLSFSDVTMVKFFGQGLKEIIGDGIDLLFCNEAEAYAYTETENLKEAANILKRIAKTFAITLGPKGALVFDGKEEILIPTVAVEPIDTTGAGDLFAGAMLYGINNGMTYEEAAKLGCFAASTLVTRFGPRLSKEQVDEIKAILQ